MRGFTYKEWLIEDLRNLEKNRFSITQMREELETLEAEYASIKATNYDKQPGGATTQEDRLLTAIAKKDELEADLKATALHVEDMDRLLECLEYDDRRVVTLMFVQRERGAVQKLMEELGYEKSQVYRLRDRALRNLATLRWGRAYRP